MAIESNDLFLLKNAEMFTSPLISWETVHLHN